MARGRAVQRSTGPRPRSRQARRNGRTPGEKFQSPMMSSATSARCQAAGSRIAPPRSAPVSMATTGAGGHFAPLHPSGARLARARKPASLPRAARALAAPSDFAPGARAPWASRARRAAWAPPPATPTWRACSRPIGAYRGTRCKISCAPQIICARALEWPAADFRWRAKTKQGARTGSSHKGRAGRATWGQGA